MGQMILIVSLLVSPIWTYSVSNRLERKIAHGQILGRIAGGEEASEGEFPFSAALYITHQALVTYFCGGTLLNEQWILTSGQCAYTALDFRVEIGSIQLTADDSNRQIRTGYYYVLHPDFDPLKYTTDIALLQIDDPFQFTSSIQPIGSLPASDFEGGSDGTAIGWGETNDDNNFSEILLSVPLTALSVSECATTYNGLVDETVLCLQGGAGRGSCIGDTGSPFIIYDSDGRSIVVGVASFTSIRACAGVAPAGYARVWHFVNWINDNILEVSTTTTTVRYSTPTPTTTAEPISSTSKGTTNTEEPATTTTEPPSTNTPEPPTTTVVETSSSSTPSSTTSTPISTSTSYSY